MSTLTDARKTKNQRRLDALSMVVVAILAMLVFGRALGFAFFNDDPSGHFAWMETRSVIDFFRGSIDYGYYRPVVFTVLQSLVALVEYNAVYFHALLLLLHGANVAMLWLLARRLSGSVAYAWTAALIFATVPFSYEAVAYVASLTHPLLLFWLLLTLLLYQQAHRSDALIYDIAAFITLLLGLFSHENGLLIPFLLVGIEWIERPPRGWVEGFKRPFLPYFLGAALFFLLWMFIPKNNEETFTSLAAIFNNMVPFLQTLVYPILPIVSLSSSAVWLLIGLGLGVVILMFFVAKKARAVGIWLLAITWFILSTLPAVLFLSSDYLYGSPRLHYLPAAGVSLFWSLPVLALFQLDTPKSWWPALRTGLAAIYTLLIILPPLPFINCQLDFYESAGEIVYQMRDLAAAAPPGQDLLFVNVPFFFSSTRSHPQGCPNPYPWTPVGGVVIPPYATARDFVRFNGGPDRPSQAVVVPEYGPGWNSHGQVMSLAEVRRQLGESAVYVFDLNEGSFFPLSASWQPEQPIISQPLATFGAEISLVDASISEQLDQNQMLVTLQWQALQRPKTPVTAFVHLYDQFGRLIAQHDSPPARNFVPYHTWQPGDMISDQHTITISSPLSPGQYILAVGLYDPQTGERLPAQSNGTSLTNDVYEVQKIER